MKESQFCPNGERQMVSYLEGRLRSGERAAFEGHLEQCALCRDQVEHWKELSVLQTPMPAEGFQARFEARLEKELRQQSLALSSERAVWPKKWGLLAACAALLISALSGFSGYWFGAREAKSEIVVLQRDMQSMRSLMAVSLLQQTSAVDRLRGVNYSAGLESADDQVVSALIETLRFDSSVNVRLAAADALRRYAAKPQVRSALADALAVQDSPLLQMALIDTLVEWRESKAARSFESLSRRTDTDVNVRARLAQALRELQAGETR